MAYASLVSLEQTTDLVLNHYKYSISVDGREKITSIREYVIFLITFFQNSAKKAHRLEGKIRDLANETEDLIEYFMLNQLKMDQSVGFFIVEFESRLNRVRQEIGTITGDMMDDRLFHSPAVVSSSRAAVTGKNDVVIGLDEDLLALKGRLCGESSKLEVIPITGMGGSGKTTLARNAYDDPLILEFFHIRAWVTISQDYSVDEILSRLVDSMKLSEKNELPMAEKVYKCLKGMRYLIVMDDVWSTEIFDELRNILPDDKNGSRIMLTTRLSDVATYASSGSLLHEMKFMDQNRSWDLIKQKVFTHNQDCPPELEGIGKEIAGGCRGLPLAVVLVGGVLSTINKTLASWEKIARNVYSIVDGQLDKILSLSYRLLPHHLRPCFLFMAGYPEDHKICVSRLIKLWVAEGFLKCQDGCKTLEEEAEEYLEDLVKRNLVLTTSRRSNGKIKNCGLHDLVRDMCIRKAQEEKFLLTYGYALPNGRKDERRISIGHSRLNEIRSPTIHTILCFTTKLYYSSLAFLVSFKLLRVLEVIHYCDSLPPQVFELFHLRYLAFGLTIIPAAISKLENLQTLIISSRVTLSHLPLEIWRLPNLRHLIFTGWYTLPIPADGPSFPLENLQTVTGISNFVCSGRILEMMPNLKKLRFSTRRIQSFHSLVNLHLLDKLKIIASGGIYWQGPNLAFPTSLKKLTLVGGRLPWKDLSIIGSLPNLQVLKLKKDACDGDTWETSDGGFRQLEYLLIGTSRLRHWITEKDHFPRLKCLVLRNCDYLTEIPDSIGEIPTLESIEVDGWNDSLLNSAKQIQEDQQGYGNDGLHVRKAGFEFHGMRGSIVSTETRDGEFPELKVLLNWIPHCIGETPILELIEVESRNRSLLKSAKQIQKDQRSYRNVVAVKQSFHNLVNLHQLEKLKITAIGSISCQGPHLAFPTSLKKLTLVGGRLPWKDLSIIGSLPNLQVLKLKKDACDGDTWETSDGGFRQLEYLLIGRSRLQHWITEKDHFPRLKRLVLNHCWCLREIPDSIGEIPTLELIEVDNWNKSVVKSARQIQKDQRS